MDKQRFKQLYALAHGGDMNAKSDLWLEFEFAYDHDPLPAFMNPAALPVDSSSESSVPSVVKKSQSGGRPC